MKWGEIIMGERDRGHQRRFERPTMLEPGRTVTGPDGTVYKARTGFLGWRRLFAVDGKLPAVVVKRGETKTRRG